MPRGGGGHGGGRGGGGFARDTAAGWADFEDASGLTTNPIALAPTPKSSSGGGSTKLYLFGGLAVVALALVMGGR
jgi:hypothetical protein